MCQLVLCRSLIKEPIAPALLNLLLKDTGYRNRDGAGIYSESAGIIKTEKAFNTVSWKNFFKINKSKTIIAHVRAATTSKSGKREISSDNSHPYEIDGVVFAHNGSISCKEGYTPESEQNNESTDSFNFFKEVMFCKNKNNLTVVNALKETMKNYTGKFAFLLFDGDNYYAIRGRTATLFKATVIAGETPVAVFINTEETDLKESMTLVVHLYALLYDASVDFKMETLERDTIYRLDGLELVKVGDITENDVIVQRALVVGKGSEDDEAFWYRGSKYSTTDGTPISVGYTPLHFFTVPVRAALDKLLELKIKPELFDKWSVATMGVSATSLTDKQIICLVEFITLYSKWCTTRHVNVRDYYKNNTEIHKLITEIRRSKLKNEVQWPFELNTLDNLQDVVAGEKL